MFSSLLFICTISASIHFSALTDTIPDGKPHKFRTQGDAEAYRFQQLFRDEYKPQTYQLFAGPIIQTAPGTYQFDSLTLRIYTRSDGMMELISRGLLYPELLRPIFSSTDTFSIGDFSELKHLSQSPRIKRFSCWVFNSRIANPFWYVFELTNQHGTSGIDIATFIRDARLTFLYQVSIVL